MRVQQILQTVISGRFSQSLGVRHRGSTVYLCSLEPLAFETLGFLPKANPVNTNEVCVHQGFAHRSAAKMRAAYVCTYKAPKDRL